MVASLKRSAQSVRGISRKLWRPSIDDHEQRVDLLGECSVELNLPLAPRQLGGDELAGVGVDREFFVGKEDGGQRRKRGDCKHDKRAAAASPYDSDDKRLECAPAIRWRN
jgi:hypothetical protein